MKILKSLTTAAAILLLAGCAGNGSEDKTMPVPVHEREAESEVAETAPEAEPETPIIASETSVIGKESPETRSAAAEAEDKAATEAGAKPEAKTETRPEAEPQPVRVTEPQPEKETEMPQEKKAQPVKEANAWQETEAQPKEETEASKVAETSTETASKVSSENGSATAAEKNSAIVAENASAASTEKASSASTESAPAKEAGRNVRKNRSSNAGWYAGVEGGLAFAESSFSSFGAGGTHAGGSGSLFAGYRFSGWLSLEVFAGIGGARMTARDCCSEANLWLSNDGEQFRAAILGKEGGYYSELESSVLWQNYGLRLNFDILALFPATKDGKWSLELSPAISGLGPKAKIRTMAAKTPVFNAGNWQFGAGGRIQTGYTVLPWMRAGLFTGLTFGTGRHIDALPADDHRNNFIWESGVRLTFSIPDKNCKKSGR